MKKIFAIGLAAALTFTMLAGCSKPGESQNEENTDPVIEGVKTSATVMAGEEFDALEGVTAYDEEDGDLTDKIKVEAVGLTFTNGKTTPTEPSEYIGYEIVYSVEDSDGAEATEYCTLYVKQAAAELENIYTVDFGNITPYYDYGEEAEEDVEGDNHWWKPEIEGSAVATAALKQGAFVFDVTNNGEGDGNIRLARTINDLGAGEYQFVVWAKSSVDTLFSMIARNTKAAGWETFGGAWEVPVGTTVKAYTANFTVDGDDNSIEFRIHMGKMTKHSSDEEGKEEAEKDHSQCIPSAENFSFFIEKIAIYKTTGSDTTTDVYNKASFSDIAGFEMTNAGDGAAATEGYDATEQAPKVTITQYNTSQGIWSISAVLPLTDVEIDKDARYGYEVVLKATAECGAELVLAPADNKDAANSEKKGVTIGTTETTVSGTFTAGFSSEAPGLHIQLGKSDFVNDTKTSNTVFVKSVRFYKIEGNLTTSRVAQDKFIVFGNASHDKTNAKYPFEIFNKSDDKPTEKGIGTAYIEGGKLIYKIHEAGTDGGHNKLAVGYWDNPINLPENAYYVISFTIKSSVALDFNLTLHDMNRAWGSADEGVLLRRASYHNNSAIHLDGTEQTFTFVTDDPILVATKCELLFEFGSAALTGEVTIELSALSIGVRRLAN